MTAAATDLVLHFERWTQHLLPLAAGVKAYKNATCVARASAAAVLPGTSTSATGDIRLGVFAEQKDNSAGSGTILVNVEFFYELVVVWRANDGSISASNLFSDAYVLDDASVTLTSTNRAKFGLIMAVEAARGVGCLIEIPGTTLI